MPVGPSTPSYYSTRSSYLSRNSPSSSLLLNRTTSLDRNNYSTYSTSGYGSSYGYTTPYSSRPPRPSYTSSPHYSTDSYKSSREAASPLRTSNYRLSSDTDSRSYDRSSIGQKSISDASSRYSASTVSSRLRENSSSRDSGYGSRLTSRDRSLDIKNGNLLDTKSYGPSTSSYASNYRWEGRNKSRKSVEPEDEPPEEKVKVSDRVRNFEDLDDENHHSTPRISISEEIAARRKKDEENISARRQRLGLSPIRSSRSKTPDVYGLRKQSTPERNGNDDDTEETLRQKSVNELRHKYDNGYGSSKEDDDNNETGSDSPGLSYLSSRCRITDYDSPSSKTPKTTYSRGLESPSVARKNRDSSRSPDNRSSGLTNGHKSLNHLDDPSCSSYSTSYGASYTSPSVGVRRDRVRERIAARLARELEDEDAPSSRVTKGTFSESNGLVGLRNIGNTCFLNSVTQCLSNTRCLMEYMIRESYSTDINTSSLSTMKGDLIRAFGFLFREMWTDGEANRALNTGPFKTQIQRFAPAFSGYQQHDAQEFLRKLLEGLHEDVNRVTIRPRAILDDIDDDLNDDKKAMESWKRYLRFDDSRIVDMFVGQLKSSLKCSVCSHTSVTFDPFWDLSLPIPNKSHAVKLNQCLDLFTKEEVMDGDERPTCSKCKERRKMTKSFSIQKFPKVLVLHLKRFSPTERWRGKLSCTVEFPVDNLDLSGYASSSIVSCTYNLNGVANHSGTTYSGHYTAFCKHPYSGQWHEYNDSRVSSMVPRRICSPEAYVLFYELSVSSASRL